LGKSYARAAKKGQVTAWLRKSDSIRAKENIYNENILLVRDFSSTKKAKDMSSCQLQQSANILQL
jgi:hypothetical protein